MQENHETLLMFCTSEKPCISVIGLKWIQDIDGNFDKFDAHDFNNLFKKPLLLSIVQIYDTCGWISPLVFWSKALMQHIRTLGLD